MKYAIVWPEGDCNSAQVANNWLHCFWLQFWLGIKSYWPDPRQAKRITTYWPAKDDPFAELEPDVIAYVMEQDCQPWQ